MTVRPIDANIAMKKIREYMEDFPNASTRLATCRSILSMLEDENQIPTLTPPNEWVSVEERLPENSERWETYIVTVNRSHWPTSSYDPCDAPYDEELVVSAQYDSKQKIWHLPWDEQLNALIQADDAPINGDFVTHWMPLPAPPEKEG